MSRAADAMPISPGQREALEVLARSGTAPFREVRRAQALLMAADGLPNVQIAAAVGVTAVTVRAWRTRFAEEGLAKFAQVREGRGRKPSIPAETVDEIVRVTLHETPPGATHWSTRTMAARVGVSRDTVHRVWRARGLQPHRVETFKLSNDPRFEEKLVDVVGLYLNPPDKAVVLCLDEKSQVQALDRTQPSLPMKKGRAGTMTPRLQAARHDDSVRRPRRADRGGHRAVPAPAPPRRVPRFPAPDPARSPPRPAGASHPRQLRHAQPSRCPGLAGQASPVSPALHPHELVVAQPRGALVPQSDRQTVAPRQLQLGSRPHRRHRGVPDHPQRGSEALRVDRHLRLDPREGSPRPRCPRGSS